MAIDPPSRSPLRRRGDPPPQPAPPSTPNRQAVNLYLDQDLMRVFRERCSADGRIVSRVVEKLIRDHLQAS